MEYVYIMMYLITLIVLIVTIKNNAHRQVVRYFK